MQFLKAQVGVLVNDLIRVDEIRIIKQAELALYDEQSDHFKSVFIFIDPSKATI